MVIFLRRVLVVDDALFMRYTIGKVLIKNGFTVLGEAENGREAISKYIELKPDIVTMDITMPEMSGLESLKNIIQFDPRAKIIIVSAIGEANMVKEAIISGAKAFIVKPFNEEQVVKTLNQVLSQ